MEEEGADRVGAVQSTGRVLGRGTTRLAWCIFVVARVDELKCIARYLKCINSAMEGERGRVKRRGRRG